MTTAQLHQLTTDRRRLQARTRVPWGLAAAGGAGLAWFVADAATAHPGAGYQAGTGYLIATAALLLVAHLIQRETGVRFRRLGAVNWLILTGVGALTLILFSVALGLTAGGLRWLTAIPIFATWALGTLAVGAVVRNCLAAMSRD